MVGCLCCYLCPKNAALIAVFTLQGLRYAVFGLGNRQYEHFCAVGKRVYKAMQSLGAEPVGPRGDGDDDEDIEEDFDKWRTDLYEALDKTSLFSMTKVQSPCSGAKLWHLLHVASLSAQCLEEHSLSSILKTAQGLKKPSECM